MVLATLQLSVLPECTSLSERVAFPEPSRNVVTSVQEATGEVVSWTVTVAEQVLELPLTSVTVRVTALEPVLEQVKLVVLRLVEATPQLSLLPLSISPAVIVALPLPSSETVTFWQTAIGEIVSWTVAAETRVEELPLPSLTVRVTLLLPTLLQLKDVVLALVLLTLQLSELPLSMSVAVMDALPLPSN